MLILGVTGSIAMGKSTAVGFLRDMGFPVHDADGAVHRLMAPGGAAVQEIAAAFPETWHQGGIDRAKLRAAVLDSKAGDERLTALEEILHPLVRAETRRFLAAQARARRGLVVLDIPLLFETGAETRCDLVLVVSAPRRVQQQRLFARRSLSAEQLARIEARQLPDAEKRALADFVVPSGLGKAVTRRALCSIVTDVRGLKGPAWSPHWD